MRKSVQETAAKKLKIESTVKNDVDADDDDDGVIKTTGKRKISCVIDSDTESEPSDSDSNYKNDENESDNSQDGSKLSRKKKEVSVEPMKKKSKTIEEKLKANKDESHSPMNVDDSSVDFDDVAVVHKHRKIDWLKPDKIRDANNRRPDDPEYDPTTLYLPAKFLDEQTPVCILYFTINN